MNMPKSIAIVAAHPDDEVLGCGATMAKHVAAGDRVHVLILAEGATSRDEHRNEALRAAEIAALKEAAREAARLLGVAVTEFGGFPDNRMDTVDFLDVVKRVECFMQSVIPDAVYTHHRGDMNLDHCITQRAVATALRPLPGQCFATLLEFEVPSSTEWAAAATSQPFVPNWFEDVSGFLATKIAALEIYASEMRSFPHPRSREGVEALARVRGSTVGVPAAEAFVLGWQVNRLKPSHG